MIPAPARRLGAATCRAAGIAGDVPEPPSVAATHPASLAGPHPARAHRRLAQKRYTQAAP